MKCVNEQPIPLEMINTAILSSVVLREIAFAVYHKCRRVTRPTHYVHHQLTRGVNSMELTAKVCFLSFFSHRFSHFVIY